jgi:lysophospholipase L1-like esterase
MLSRRTRPRSGARRTLGLLGVLALLLSAAACSADSGRTRGRSTSTVATTSLAVTTTSARPSPPSPPPPAPRLDDGSLGNEATRVACRLLSRAQIKSQFGGPVSPATPTYPYCQWLIGLDAFLALEVEPDTSFNTATQYVATLETVSGVGQQAIIANNRYLYFTSAATSYWLLYQQVGDFSELHTSQLVALARDVLSHDEASERATPPVPGPVGPPIYFAGDSTAAGPEWAWDTYHVNSPEWRTLAEYQVGSGLISPGYFDWSRHLLAVVAARRPKLVIYMGSANDGQGLVIDGAVQPVGSPLWNRAYGARVGDIMSSLVREGAKVLWIGEPAMQDPQLSGYMKAMDAVCAEQAARHRGVSFFNPGSALDGPGGSYAADRLIDGEEVSVRLDGVHLNMEGSIYLANYIAKYVSRILPLQARVRAAPGAIAIQRRPGVPRA